MNKRFQCFNLFLSSGTWHGLSNRSVLLPFLSGVTKSRPFAVKIVVNRSSRYGSYYPEKAHILSKSGDRWKKRLFTFSDFEQKHENHDFRQASRAARAV
jgi:hypothetical protein